MPVGFLAHLRTWNRLFFTKTSEIIMLPVFFAAGKNHGIQIALSLIRTGFYCMFATAAYASMGSPWRCPVNGPSEP